MIRIRLTRLFLMLVSIFGMSLTLISAQTEQPLVQTIVDFKPISVKWSPDGELISVGYSDGTMIFDTQIQVVATLESDSDLGQSWNSDATLFVTGGGFYTEQGTIQVWRRDLKTNSFTLEHQFINSYLDIIAAEISPNDEYLATISRSLIEEAEFSLYTIEIWDTNSWSLKTSLRHQYLDGYPILSWSPDSTRIAGVGWSYLIDGKYDRSDLRGTFISDIESGNRLAFIKGDYDITPTILSWSANNELATNFPALNIYDYNGEFVRSIGLAVGFLDWNPQGTIIAEVLDKYVRIRSGKDGTFIQGFESEPNIRALDWSPDGNSIVVITEDGIIQIWDVSAYVERRQ